MRARRRRTRTSRDPVDWSKLAYAAQKRRGTGGLQVLQDAIMSDPDLARLFVRAQNKADKKSYAKATPYCVVFCTSIMRGYLRSKKPPTKPHWWKDEPGGQHTDSPWETSYSNSEMARAHHSAFVEKQGWPFDVVARSRLHTLNIGIRCTLVYDSHLGLNVHSLKVIQERFRPGGPEAPGRGRSLRDRSRERVRRAARRCIRSHR